MKDGEGLGGVGEVSGLGLWWSGTQCICAHVCGRVCVRAYVRVPVCRWVCMCVRVCVCACLCVWGVGV